MTSPTGGGTYAIDGYLFGQGNNGIQVQNVALAQSSFNTQDQQLFGDDATLYGTDTIPSQQVTFTAVVLKQGDPLGTLQAFNAFASVWNNPTIRLVPGALSKLELWYKFSSELRFTYGRGRQLTPTMGSVNQGAIPFTASFQTVDASFYSSAKVSTVVDFWAPPTGIKPPVITPIVGGLQPWGFAKQYLTNTGLQPTFPIIQIYGPVIGPKFTFVDIGKTIGYAGTLKAKQVLTLDCRPWKRSALLDDGRSAAGDLIGNAKLIDFVLPSGSSQVSFTGTPVHDHSSTSLGGGFAQTGMRCVVSWWNANPFIGG